MTCVEGLESADRILGVPIVPELHSNFLTINHHNFQGKVTIRILNHASSTWIAAILVQKRLDERGFASLRLTYYEYFLNRICHRYINIYLCNLFFYYF